MKNEAMILILAVCIMAIMANPVAAMWDTADCYSAAFHKWQNISANVACFMSIIMNEDQIDYDNGIGVYE